MRYAIYYLPPAGQPVGELGQDWLGRDVTTGQARERPPMPDLADMDLAGLTSAPRHYGFHATLKAPFALADGVAESDLVAALDRFAADRVTFSIALTVGALGPYIALVLGRPSAPMASLADDSVRIFDPLRAPLDQADMARRQPQHLGERQRNHLERWGYPYVFEDFTFHMTLTDAVRDPVLHGRLHDALADLFGPIAGAPVPVDSVCLFAQGDRASAFRLMHRAPFGA